MVRHVWSFLKFLGVTGHRKKANIEEVDVVEGKVTFYVKFNLGEIQTQNLFRTFHMGLVDICSYLLVGVYYQE